MRKKIFHLVLTASMLSLSVHDDRAWGATVDAVPSPTIDIRSIVGNLFLDGIDLEEPFSKRPIGSRIYIYPIGLNQDINNITPLIEVDQRQEVEINHKKVRLFIDENVVGHDYAYYIKPEKDDTCIGYALFEYVGAQNKDNQDKDILDIHTLLLSKGFKPSLHSNAHIVPPNSRLRLTYYEKSNANYLERIVVATIDYETPTQAVLAEIFYPQDMDDEFRRLLTQWLRVQVDRNNNFDNQH